jgi:hypothetical protein
VRVVVIQQLPVHAELIEQRHDGELQRRHVIT